MGCPRLRERREQEAKEEEAHAGWQEYTRSPETPLPKSKFTWGRTSESFDFMYLPQEGLNFLWVRSILALSKNSFFVIAFCFYA